MPRSRRFQIPGQVWHITHRCHRQQFLLKFARDRRLWRYWLFEARKRYGLCVLNYIVTSNHIHLLVRDQGKGEIAQSMQLVAGRVAQAYNRRKQRKGAFWEDRYHATAVEKGDHLARCLVYIDLNMVRAGQVTHPANWETSGYREIQSPPRRYRIIDLNALQQTLGMEGTSQFRTIHREWVEQALADDRMQRDPRWSGSLAVGSKPFMEEVRRQMGPQVYTRRTESDRETTSLHDSSGTYMPNSNS
ncbi:transposase [Guyparkeria halophila]|uniref:Transposase n=1 Tax=Guyparkeria halophila TaxID=47960 RepID=A0ABZ0YYG5_9GAMM|nr:transposase [Guyparkeria halophila]WQH17236.1 transposase [Guyparkeria halophila]